ncbi:MAG TPA: hypothetical protein VNN08_15795 [Thermoanaerobaculia bacterium]|nr:hypothetical protein [Thermoanaerobaculia bacterium]
MKKTVSPEAQMVAPATLRNEDSVESDKGFDAKRLDCGEYRPAPRAAVPNEGAVDWLLACPEKGFFVPIGSEPTDAW